MDRIHSCTLLATSLSNLKRRVSNRYEVTLRILYVINTLDSENKVYCFVV